MKILSTAAIIYTTLATLFLSARPQSASAQTDTIRLADKRLNTAALKPGTRQYLVYFQNPKKQKSLSFMLWLRNTQISNRDGQKVFITTQHWYGNDSTSYREAYSVNRLSDFAPIYHSETIANKNRAYNWAANKITGADSAATNTVKNFALDFKEPTLNWNLDIETFEMLPLAAGKTFAINFYDTGSIPPAYVLYKVTGSEIVTTLDNQKIDCWKLFNESDYQGRHFTETFWISKKGHELLKEEDTFNGGYRYKIKMPGLTPDVAERFKVK
ncbi:hypothetical protein FFF34_015910 [Inquilinus sp. KBS0705]|nr:hypothetical protein FFF34_015910 [Inquilinus sp. KBS0705]